MIVNFEIDLPGGLTVTEQDLERDDGSLRAQLLSLPSLSGGLAISDPASGESTAIGDVLGALISAFCVDGVAELIEGRPYSTRLFAYPERVDLQPDGDAVVIDGDELDSARFPLRHLVPALAACGVRYATRLRWLHAGQPEWAERVEQAETSAQASQAAVSDWLARLDG